MDGKAGFIKAMDMKAPKWRSSDKISDIRSRGSNKYVVTFNYSN
jgi:hypothetical protein